MKHIDLDLMKHFLSTIPAKLQNSKAQALEQMQPLLQNWLTQLQLVTQQEFLVQSNILQKTTEELTQLKKEFEKLKEALTKQTK